MLRGIKAGNGMILQEAEESRRAGGNRADKAAGFARKFVRPARDGAMQAQHLARFGDAQDRRLAVA